MSYRCSLSGVPVTKAQSRRWRAQDGCHRFPEQRDPHVSTLCRPLLIVGDKRMNVLNLRMQSVFSSAARRGRTDLGCNAERRDGELKTLCITVYRVAV
jgi:hypothetical protein